MKEAVRKFKETVEIKSSRFNKIRSHRYFSVTVFALCALLVFCFHVWQRVRVVNLVHEVGLLRQEYDSLLDNKKKLHSAIARLSTAARIQSFAADSLGLKPVPAEQLLTLVPERQRPHRPDELQQMFTALKRIADYMPVVEETKVKAGVIEEIEVDSTLNSWNR